MEIAINYLCRQSKRLRINSKLKRVGLFCQGPISAIMEIARKTKHTETIKIPLR